MTPVLLTTPTPVLPPDPRRHTREQDELAEPPYHLDEPRRQATLQALCEIGVPVIARDGAAGGYSLPEDCFVKPLQLSIRELLLLLLALGALERMPSVPYPKERASLVAKLRALVPKPRKKYSVADPG